MDGRLSRAQLTLPPEPQHQISSERLVSDPVKLAFVSSAEGRALKLRGINARVVGAGMVRVGDVVEKVGTV